MPPGLRRNGGLVIRHRIGPPQHFEVLPYGNLFQPPRTWHTEIPLSQMELFGHVDECRKLWQRAIVEYVEAVPNREGGERNSFPFQERWSFRKRPQLLEHVGRELALAGEKLFFLLFKRGSDNLGRVAEVLTRASQERRLVLTITSDDFFVPWGMLYVHPDPVEPLAVDGSNYSREGFWGMRHIIEHNPLAVLEDVRLRAGSGGVIPASLNLDERIDVDLRVRCIASQRAFFQTLDRIKLTERCKKAQLLRDLANKNFPDRILYFFCHGTGSRDAEGRPNLEQTHLVLSDDPISASDIAYALRDQVGGLASHPVVFINACQGGQMETVFYRAIAAEFLRQNAVGVIGAQIDLPAVFADQYARQFFKALLSPGRKRRRVGPLMRLLTRRFWIKNNNPLGIAYSLYRGLDCFVDG
jgi:hypothetical protein